MKVRLLKQRVGASFDLPPGAEIDVPDDEAARLFARALAEPVIRRPEVATKRRGEKRG
jgi:hypothetical protein